MKKIILFLLMIGVTKTQSQELYPNSEPASIIPKQAFGVRLMNEAYANGNSIRSWHGTMFMYGVSSKLMFSAMVTGSNHHNRVLPADYIQKNADQTDYVSFKPSQNYNYLFESVNLGFRYRFLNVDGDHKHFRMAAYGNGVYSYRPHDEAEVSLMGDNKGVGGGVIATALFGKLAISATGGVIKPFSHKETSGIEFQYGDAYNYNLSFGYLLLPFKYKNFKQTNVNLYAEFIGKKYNDLTILNSGNQVRVGDEKAFKGGNYVEFRPAVQFIVKSNLRIDCSTALPIVGKSYIRKYPMYLLNVQYYFFL